MSPTAQHDPFSALSFSEDRLKGRMSRAHAAPMAELWRNGILESVHTGHLAIVDRAGQVVASFGDPDAVIFPRSACKMIQALPLIETGAAAAAGLSDRQLALSCASHQGDAIHVNGVRDWLGGLGASQDDLRCGSHLPYGVASRDLLIKTDTSPCPMHNNCSGKHAGFVTTNRHIGGDGEYNDVSHPLQVMIKGAFEEVTDLTSPGYGVDGCSAPNFATTVTGLARAMAGFASAGGKSGARAAAQVALTNAMMAHPDMVAGEGRACTELMRAMKGRAAIKTGAEAVFTAILPEAGLGVALKVADGATRGSECAIATVLVGLGVLDASDPVAQKYLNSVQRNCNGFDVAAIRPAPELVALMRSARV